MVQALLQANVSEYFIYVIGCTAPIELMLRRFFYLPVILISNNSGFLYLRPLLTDPPH
jgi:hypothetical protein